MDSLNIPPLPPQQPQWPDFQVWWQQVKQALETANSDLSEQIDALTTVNRNDAISVSYTAPGVILSADDAGTDATVTVADHNRLYGDHTVAAVTGGTVTALDYSTDYYIFYDQLDRSGGTVLYRATTNPNIALPNKVAGRHFVGKVTTPAALGGATSGGSAPPAGGGSVDKSEIHSTL